ncbi:MAG: hypothetical protein WDZ75_01825 [Candidatus Paceibacterota bacterium]
MAEKQADKKVFIQANESQYLGALLGKFSIERVSPGIPVEILLAEEIPAFQNFVGSTYKQGSEERAYSLEDEQSFTLTRFMPPEIMGYEGRAVVIDPDVFAVKDIRPLFDTDMEEAGVACCKRESFWDTSVMLLENSKLNWEIADILKKFSEKELNYNTAIRKVFEEPVKEISRKWNSLDELTDTTHIIHYTRQRTQPWKTGLPYTVTPRSLGKKWGIIPKEWLPEGRKRYPTHYQKHPDKEARNFFFEVLKNALRDGVITKDQIEKETREKRIRPDLLSAAGF